MTIQGAYPFQPGERITTKLGDATIIGIDEDFKQRVQNEDASNDAYIVSVENGPAQYLYLHRIRDRMIPFIGSLNINVLPDGSTSVSSKFCSTDVRRFENDPIPAIADAIRDINENKG